MATTILTWVCAICLSWAIVMFLLEVPRQLKRIATALEALCGLKLMDREDSKNDK